MNENTENRFCATCVNRGSPACEKCRYTAKAGGGINTPTWYLAELKAEPDGGERAEMSILFEIRKRIDGFESIPYILWKRYNNLIAETHGGG